MGGRERLNRVCQHWHWKETEGQIQYISMCITGDAQVKKATT